MSSIFIILLLINKGFTITQLDDDLSFSSTLPSIIVPENNLPSIKDPLIKMSLKVKAIKSIDIIKEINKNSYIYTQDNLRNKNYFTVYDALENTTGVTINSAFKDVVDIRGQGEDAQRRVQVLFDDIPLNILDNTHYVPGFDIFPSPAIEKVEIIPGGGSVIYGNGTQGGVVNILTNFRSEHSKPNNQLYAGFASFNTKRFAASLGNYFLKNKLFLQLDYSKVDDNAYARKEWAKKEFINFSTKYNLTENHIVGYSYSTYTGNGIYTNNISPDKIKEDWLAHGDLNKYNRNENFYKISYQGKLFDKFTIDNLAFYHKHEYLQENLSSKRGIKNASFPQKVKGNKLKARLNYGKNSKSFLLIGNDVISTHFEIISDIMSKWEYEKNTYAIFALNKLYWNSFYLLSGYRFNLDNWYKKYPAGNKAPSPDNIKYIESKNDKILHNYNVGLGLDLTKNNSTWINFETGFSAPESMAFTNKVGAQYKPNPNIKYETYQTFEVGTEHRLNTTGTYLRAVGFNTYTKDEITMFNTSFNKSLYCYYINIGNTKRTGLEVNIEQHIYKDIISLNFGITAINAKYKNINHTALKNYITDIKENSPLPPQEIDKSLAELMEILEDRKGKTIKKVPHVTLNSRLSIKIIEPLIFSINSRYLSPYMINYTFEENEKAGGKLITDVNLTYRLEKLYITLGINNITNEKYFITDNYISKKLRGTEKGKCRPAMPINYFFDLKFRF